MDECIPQRQHGNPQVSDHRDLTKLDISKVDSFRWDVSPEIFLVFPKDKVYVICSYLHLCGFWKNLVWRTNKMQSVDSF